MKETTFFFLGGGKDEDVIQKGNIEFHKQTTSTSDIQKSQIVRNATYSLYPQAYHEPSSLRNPALQYIFRLSEKKIPGPNGICVTTEPKIVS